jgi:hypothetical protein
MQKNSPRQALLYPDVVAGGRYGEIGDLSSAKILLQKTA